MFAARRLFRLRRANAAPDVLLVFDYLIAKFAVDVNGQIVASVGINEIEADFPFRSVGNVKITYFRFRFFLPPEECDRD